MYGKQKLEMAGLTDLRPALDMQQRLIVVSSDNYSFFRFEDPIVTLCVWIDLLSALFQFSLDFVEDINRTE